MLSSTRSTEPSETPASPGPLKVVAADFSIDVEDLAAQKQIWMHATAHRIQVDLRQRHASCRHLRIIEAAVTRNGKMEFRECSGDVAALLARQFADRTRRRHLFEDAIGHRYA